MIRVVLDTNVIVSALLSPHGLPAQAFLMVMQEPDARLCISGEVFAEYEEVIRRPKFRRSDIEIEATLGAIRDRGLWCRPTEKIRVCSDPFDDIFLECAQAADAHYLVTGNTKHFPSVWERTQVVTARQFLDALM